MGQTYLHKNGRYATQYDPDLVLRTIAECGTQAAAARKLGMLQSTVNRIARKHGIHAGRGNRPRTRTLSLDEAIARYRAGETCAQIAATMEVPADYIRKRLRQAGVKGVRGPRTPEANFQWKGGKTPPMHYYRRQSYEVAAICLGRPLPQGWVIHHLDEDPKNNRWENFVLFESQSLHCRYHQQLLRLQREGEPVDAIQLALRSGGVLLPLPGNPIQLERGIGEPDHSETQQLLEYLRTTSERRQAIRALLSGHPQ